MSRKSALEKVPSPAQSRRPGLGSRASPSFVSARAIVSRPIGTLTKKIHSQPRESTSTPPTSGPTATPTPTLAPQIPSAVLRSRGANSCAIRASTVPNIAAPPIPCRPRARLSVRASLENPASSDAVVNPTSPAVKTSLRPSRSASEPAISA
jgi:hypothetical protein